MIAKIHPSKLRGEVSAPPSKSHTHRALLASAFAPGKSLIYNPLFCDDTRETIRALEKLGAGFEIYPDRIIVRGRKPERRDFLSLEIPASGSTLRMLVPPLKGFVERLEIKTTPRMLERLASPDLEQLAGLNISFRDGKVILEGRLQGGSISIEPVVTTQWLSGLIFALPFLPGSEIRTSYPLAGSYPALTLEVAQAFGINFRFRNGSLRAENHYLPAEYRVEGDYSAAANWLVTGSFSSDLRVGGLNPASQQPDSQLFAHLSAMGVPHKYENGYFSCGAPKPLAAEIDVSRTPDLFPVLAALASVRPGVTRISGLKKLKYKESDRAEMTARGLGMLGADIKLLTEEAVIVGKEMLAGGVEIDAAGDHRLIMAFAILSGKIKEPFAIRSAEGMSKSYPDFFKTFLSLGGRVEFL